jgi:hypothetical protein
MSATIIRPLHGRIEVHGLRAPSEGEPSNREMFKDAAGGPIRPDWVPAPTGRPYWEEFWTIAREHLTVVAEAIALRDRFVDIEMHYSGTERCDYRCQNAQGDDCTCSCEGARHGEGLHAAWRQVGDTTLVRSTGEKIVKRRLRRADLTESQ